MPTTVKQSPYQPRRAKVTTGTKRQRSRDKIVNAIDQHPKGGTTIMEAAPQLSTEPRKARALKLRAEIAKLERELKSLEVVQIPKVSLPELHDKKTGRIDAQKVADFMGVALKPLSEGLGLNYKAVHRNPSSSSFQGALRPVKRSLELLHEFFGPEKAIRVWLNSPHPDLGGVTALDTILEGKAHAVALILENAWNGVPV